MVLQLHMTFPNFLYYVCNCAIQTLNVSRKEYLHLHEK